MTRHTGFLALAGLALICGCSSSSPTAPTQPRGEFSQTDIIVGTGVAASNGRLVTVNYTGWLYSATAVENKGTQFETSIGRAPLPFTLGIGAVIRGWDQGVVGMRVGGIRRLVIPPELAYGSTGKDPIPPNATLVFDVELLAVQ